MIYLIHFDREYKGCNHYLGYTEKENVEERFNRHKAGRGARLLKVLNDNNIDYKVVRTWDKERSFERKLKKQKKARKLCPVCNPDSWQNNKKGEAK